MLPRTEQKAKHLHTEPDRKPLASKLALRERRAWVLCNATSVQPSGRAWMGLAEYCFASADSQDTVELSMRGKEPLALLLCVPWLRCFDDGSKPPAQGCSGSWIAVEVRTLAGPDAVR